MSDREETFDYVSAENPRAAVALDERIRAQVEKLTSFPESGRPGRIRGTRELLIQGTPYIVAYHLKPGLVFVLRVLHGARSWPDTMPDG